MTESLEQEIRTLRSIFWSARDPEGRAFVPLADAYRRAGDFRQAMALLTEGLDRHPDFASAHAVAAQLYLDSGLLQEAELASRRVLDLDGDNVVGLRCLASSLKGQGREPEADALSAQLEELQGDEVPEEDAEPTAADTAGAEEPSDDVVDIAELAPDQSVQAAVADVIPGEPVVDLDALAPDEAVVDVADLAPDVSSAELDADAATAGVWAVTPDEPVIDVEDLAPEGVGATEPYDDALLDDEPAPLVTRTLAELYARQGQTERAVEVYRQLLEATPGDEDLLQRIAELEAGVDEVEAAVDTEPLEADAPEPEPVEAEVVDVAYPAASTAGEDTEGIDSATEEEDVQANPWDAEAQQELHEVDTPFAWTEEEREEVPAGPPISAYFAGLLAWEPGGAEGDAESAEYEPRADADEAGDDADHDGFTDWLNQEET